MKIDDLLEHAEKSQSREEPLEENLLAAAAAGATGYFGLAWVGSTVLSAIGLGASTGLLVTPLVGLGVTGAGFYGIFKGIQWIRGKAPTTQLGKALRKVTGRWKKEQSNPRIKEAMKLYSNIEQAIVERDEIIAESANVPEEDREYYFMSRRGDIAKATQKMQRNAKELEDLLITTGEEVIGQEEITRMRNSERNPLYQDDILMSVRNRDNILKAGASELGIFREEFDQMMGWIHGAKQGELTAIRTK